MKVFNIFSLDSIPAVASKPEERRACCPWCLERVGKVDTSFKLHFNTRNGLYHCFRCEASGRVNLKSGVLLLPQNDNKGNEELLAELREKVNNIGNYDFKSEEFNFDLDKISYTLSKDETPIAYKYLSNRGITDEEMSKFNIRVGKSYINEEGITVSRWRGRVLFPFIENSKVVYIVGRSYTGKEPKYLNSSNSKSGIVYNIDSVNGKAILTEGIISGIAAERYTKIPAVSLLGKTAVSYKMRYKELSVDFSVQLEKIRSKADILYISLDGEVDIKKERASRDIVKKALDLSFILHLVKLPFNKDPDDLKEDYLIYFNQAKKINLIGEVL